MRRRIRRASVAASILIVVAVLFVSQVARADPPDSEFNPVNGYIESVDIVAESNDRVRHVEDPGRGEPETTTLVSTSAAANPRIAIDPDGDSWVVWWQDAATDAVYFSVRDLDTGTWSQEEQVSETGVDSQNPEIVYDGSAAYVAFEADDAGDTSVVVAIIVDDPEPITVHSTITTTTYTGDVDVKVHAKSGYIWATWVDSSTEVGWSEYDSQLEQWDQPQYESYQYSTVSAARDEIRDTVLGP